jgi:hypothetical protein
MVLICYTEFQVEAIEQLSLTQSPHKIILLPLLTR